MNSIGEATKLNIADQVGQAVASLKANGIDARFVGGAEEVRREVFSIIPEGAEVMTMTSVTLDTFGISKEINESGKYNSVRSELNAGGDKKKMKALGAAPEWAIGSVHAVTQDGKILIASNTGSQLPAYAYAAGKVVFVIGAQKIVKNFEEGMKRIYEHTLPLESERAKKAYGVPGSAVNKILVINKEGEPGRIFAIIVNEEIGF
ncbi:LUD domain-containing protein [Candidatus Giovannonibacteria bacterium]|nr:LUD domain-containing protein [Candidatus Giovannonibacteria bacterium]